MRMTTMPPTASPRPFQSAAPRRMSGPNWTVATSLSRIGVPPCHHNDALFEVLERFHVAATAQHELASGHFEHARADLGIGIANSAGDLERRHAVRGEFRRI
jgi:hypothetical protein